MSVKLMIQVDGPIEPGDKEVLGAAAMMFIVLGGTPVKVPIEDSGDEEDEEESEAVKKFAESLFAEAMSERPCDHPDPTDTGKVCVGMVGHRGRHLFRRPLAAPAN